MTRMRVRPRAVCVCRDGDRILVNAAVDAVKRERYHRPLVGEESSGLTFVAQWLPLETFAPGGPPLYPDGLYALLRRCSTS